MSRNPFLLMTLTIMTQACHQEGELDFAWRQLPQLPDPVGFAGAFSGISGGHLLVAGGSNFPENTRPWSGGTKYWSDRIFALEKGAAQWKEIGRLPKPMGYGVSLTWRDQLVMLGGADQQEHYRDAYLLRYADDQLVTDTLPDLPEPNAYASGALIGDVVYIAGGLDAPQAQSCKHSFWSLDLSKPAAERQWKKLDPWPGDPRMLSVAGAMDGAFYLLSGVLLEVPTGDSLARRKYLTDAFRYLPDSGWEKISDLPHAVAAAPSPAHAEGGQLLVFGGDDGSLADQNSILKDEHPGFNTAIVVYDQETAGWRKAGSVLTDKQPDAENNPNASTWAPVTTPLVVWDGEVILPTGEARPGVRTNRVLAVKPSTK